MRKKRDIETGDRLGELDEIDESARALLRDLDVRPLSTRSLLLSFLLGTHPPEVSAARLVAFGELFGVRPGTVRTALSRAVAAGEVVADGGRYSLGERLLGRQRQLDVGRRPVEGWDGCWWTVIVAAEERSSTARRRFRADLTGARFGEVRPELWMRPANVVLPELPDGVLVTRGPLERGDGRSLVMRWWDVTAIEQTSARLTRVLEPLGPWLSAGVGAERVLPLAFDVSTACVRHLRVEPQLPAELVDMPSSTRLRAVYADVNQRFTTALDAHLRRR